jgi:hypothetical protein
MTARRSVALLLGVLLVAGLGCGRKGPPLPPRPVIPAAVSGLRVEPQGGGLLVSWSRPTRNQDGSPLQDLVEFRLSRSPGSVPDGPSGFSLLTTVRADAPGNATVEDGRYAFLDDGGGQGLRQGARYTYRVHPVNRRGVLGPPAQAGATYPGSP